LAICWNNGFGEILVWRNHSKATRVKLICYRKYILARFKLGDCMTIRQFAKFSSLPIFVLIRYASIILSIIGKFSNIIDAGLFFNRDCFISFRFHIPPWGCITWGLGLERDVETHRVIQSAYTCLFWPGPFISG